MKKSWILIIYYYWRLIELNIKMNGFQHKLRCKTFEKCHNSGRYSVIIRSNIATGTIGWMISGANGLISILFACSVRDDAWHFWLLVQVVVCPVYSRDSTSCIGVVCANFHWSFGAFLIHYLLRASRAKMARIYATRRFCLLQHFYVHDIIPPQWHMFWANGSTSCGL